MENTHIGYWLIDGQRCVLEWMGDGWVEVPKVSGVNDNLVTVTVIVIVIIS